MVLSYIFSLFFFIILYCLITVTYEDSAHPFPITPKEWWKWTALVSFMIPYVNFIVSIFSLFFYNVYIRKTYSNAIIDYEKLPENNKLIKSIINWFNNFKTPNGKN